ncbi:MAG: hypothetical protein AAB895_01600, partial [Patescibacteria group bacterium]
MLIKMSRKYRDAKEPERPNSVQIHITTPPKKEITTPKKPSSFISERKPKGMDWESWKGAYLHGLPDHFKFGTDI